MVIVGVVGLVIILCWLVPCVVFALSKTPITPKHQHDWYYGKSTFSGWGIVRCRTCGESDLY